MITKIQTRLKAEGTYTGAIDGDWGPQTMAAWLKLKAKQSVQIPDYLLHAIKDLGIKEISGTKHHPRILQFHDHTELDANTDEISWCASAVNCWLEETNHKGTKSAAARSFVNYGVEVTNPMPGTIVVLKRGTSTWEGHVAFFLEGEGDTLVLFGGNQSNQVCVREFSRSKLLAFRRPNA